MLGMNQLRQKEDFQDRQFYPWKRGNRGLLALSKYNTIVKISILGSGTSHGVPMIGCDCSVCRSANPKNKRNRPCALVTTNEGRTILIDTPPELRLIAIEHRLRRIDAVLYTHSHADHIFGMDDLRAFNYLQKSEIPLYAQSDVIDDLRRSFHYCFVHTQAGGGKPQLVLNEIHAGQPFDLFNLTISPLAVMHGTLPILAYKLGERCAYVTDVSLIPPESLPYLKKLDLLFLDAVRYQPHATHFHMARALEVIHELNPKRTVLIHLSHDYDHEKVNKELPDYVELAYDGMEITLD
jgi:phosphoribosyl 1,2-cyclic phosphate phosphodiesterase